MIRPEPLKTGDRVAVIAPASPIKENYEETLSKALANIKAMGWEPVIFPSCRTKHGYLSGNDALRASDVQEAFLDDSIQGIICLRGGYGTPRILSMLDYGIVRDNPKVFHGYSDITGLHMAFQQQCDLITYHGPMATDLLNDAYSHQSIEDHLTGHYLHHPWENPIGYPMEPIVTGKAEGLLTGGNLSLLVSTLGSPYELDTNGKILFIEEVEEPIYKIDRMLNTLALAGKFKDCEGIILGTWRGCKAEQSGLTLDEVINEVVKPWKKPLVNNVRAGHVYPQMTLALGETVVMDVTETSAQIDYKTE